MTERDRLLADVAWLQRSLEERDPYVDPLNLIQVELLRRARACEDDEVEELSDLLRQSIQSIAAGMRTTG